MRCRTPSTSTGCVSGFPNCKLCMIHGADPWWDVAIRLLIKYANLRLMTSAWSPKRLPESLLHYMRTRGPDKVIFASDWPVLRMRRVVPEALALDLPAEVLDNYLYNNAAGILLREAGALTMDRYELRRLDYSLSEDHVDLQTAYQQFFKTHCPIETVRAAEPSGFDKRPVGAVVRDGRDDDGAAGVRRRRRGDAGRPHPGGRGDRPVAGAGAVDRPCLRRPAAGAVWARWCRHRRCRQRRAARRTRRAASTACRVPG